MVLLTIIAIASIDRPWFGLVKENDGHSPKASSKARILQVDQPFIDKTAFYSEQALPPLTACNNEARSALLVHSLQSHFPLHGQTQSVYVLDTGSADEAHPGFTGRIINLQHRTDDGHATHVTGTILSSISEAKGIAPELSALVMPFVADSSGTVFYTNPLQIESAFTDAVSREIRLLNASIGVNVNVNGYSCELLGQYGLASYVVDRAARGVYGSPVLSIWAAGNERNFDTCGDYGTIAPPATNKNALTVGATYSDLGTVALFSSFGPTNDGRLKPDLVAPGAQLSQDLGISSLEPGDSIGTRSGTSMAAPCVTGTAALLHEAWTMSPATSASPTPECLRAIVCGTTTDISTQGPDYRSGFGLLNASSALDAVMFGNALDELFQFGSPLTHQIISDGSPLRCTIAWSDNPTDGSDSAIQRNLDLILISPSGIIHYPWQLDPFNPSFPAVRSEGTDSLNTIEQVSVDQPEEGTWLMFITGDGEGPGIQIPVGVCVDGGHIKGSRIGVLSEKSPALSGSNEIDIQIWATNNGLPLTSSLEAIRVLNEEEYGLELEPIAPGKFSTKAPIPPCGETAKILIRMYTDGELVAQFPASGERTFTAGSSSKLTRIDDTLEKYRSWSSYYSIGVKGWRSAQLLPSPDCTSYGIPKHGPDGSGNSVLITGYDTGLPICGSGVEGGYTAAESTPFPVGTNTLAFDYWFSPGVGVAAHSDDDFIIQASWDDGTNWHEVHKFTGPEAHNPGLTGWRDVQVDLSLSPGYDISQPPRIRLFVEESGFPSLVVAAVANIQGISRQCEPPILSCDGDANGDNQVDFEDVLSVLLLWADSCQGCPEDVDHNGTIGFNDLLVVLLEWDSEC